MKKIVFLSIALLLSVFIAKAQTRHIDLSLSIHSPENNYELPFGDTVHIIVKIKNNGNDTIQRTDTIEYEIIGFPGNSVMYDTVLAPGDSLLLHTLSASSDDSQLEDDTSTICLRLIPASTYVDTNATNNETCLTTIFKGANSVGIKKTNSQKQFAIYPNPTKNQLNIDNVQNVKAIYIYDLLGRKVLEQSINSEKVQIDLNTLNPGFYNLNIQTKDNSIYYHKINKL